MSTGFTNVCVDNPIVVPSREVYAFLSALNDIADDRQKAFQAQIYALLRAGLPVEMKSGRGREGAWVPNDVLLLTVGIELLQMSIPASRVVHLLSSCWPDIRHDLASEGKTWLRSNDEGRLLVTSEIRRFWRIHPEGFTAIARRNRAYATGSFDRIERLSGAEIADRLEESEILEWRHLLIDVTKFVSYFLRFATAKGLYRRGDLISVLDALEAPHSQPEQPSL